jgi:hypothetical protein
MPTSGSRTTLAPVSSGPREDIEMLHDTPRRHPARWAVATLAASTVVLGTVACSAAPAAIALDNVGKIDGSTALVAVVAADDKLIAYVCDGDAALGERFAGTAAGGHADLRSSSGAQLVVDLTADAAEGTFTAAHGAPQHFTTVATTSDEAGYFVAEGVSPAAGQFSAGWVELNDGTQTGVSRTGPHQERARRLVHHRAPVGRPQGSTAPNPGTVRATEAPTDVRLRDSAQILRGGSRASALVAGVGEVAPTRVVTNDLFKRVGDR